MLHIFLFCVGCCIGSFFNVALSRHDWYRGRSRCDSCGQKLNWYDLIPVVSYLVYRGRCRRCGAAIGIRHPAAEIFMGSTFMCASLQSEGVGLYAGAIIFIGLFFLCLSAIQDMSEQMIYNWILCGGIMLCGLLRSANLLLGGHAKAAVWFAVSVCVLKLFLFFAAKAMKHKIGEGDFDIFLLLYVLCGAYGAVVSVALGSGIGCLLYIPAVIMKRYERTQPLPFAPLLFVGCVMQMLWFYT